MDDFDIDDPVEDQECAWCYGTGNCPNCNGSGEAMMLDEEGYGYLGYCEECKQGRCPHCNGSGKET